MFDRVAPWVVLLLGVALVLRVVFAWFGAEMAPSALAVDLLPFAALELRFRRSRPWHRRHEPLEGTIDSTLATTIAGAAKPVCFRAPNLFFTFEAELHDPGFGA